MGVHLAGMAKAEKEILTTTNLMDTCTRRGTMILKIIEQAEEERKTTIEDLTTGVDQFQVDILSAKMDLSGFVATSERHLNICPPIAGAIIKFAVMLLSKMVRTMAGTSTAADCMVRVAGVDISCL